MTGTRRAWFSERLFDLALLAYPRAFRRRFGSEMRRDFREARSEERRVGKECRL